MSYTRVGARYASTGAVWQAFLRAKSLASLEPPPLRPTINVSHPGVIVADLFEPWRFWPAFLSSFEAASGAPPSFATLDSVLLELPTMQVRVRAADRGRAGVPVLIVAPFALHDAAIADFAVGYSLAAVLDRAGPVALTRWKSATPEMRLLTIDSYLAELNVAVDELGGRAALVGLCQGGWLAAVYAARFPAKVAALALAGTPIDLAAAPSQIVDNVAATPSLMLQSYLAAFGGLAPGNHRRMVWTRDSLDANAREALQIAPTPALQTAFDHWNSFTVALPGPFFTEATEWLFRENRLARGCFRALGRSCDLSGIEAPIFLLMARGDIIIPPPQTLAIKDLCPRARVSVRVAEGVHLSLFMGAEMLAGPWSEIAKEMALALRPSRTGARTPRAKASLNRSRSSQSHAQGVW